MALTIFGFCSILPVSAQVTAGGKQVTISDVPLFRAADLDVLSGAERSQLIEQRLARLRTENADLERLLLIERENAVSISIDGRILLTIYDADSDLAGEGLTRQELASRVAAKLRTLPDPVPQESPAPEPPLRPRDLVDRAQEFLADHDLTGLAYNIGVALGLVVLLVVLIWLLARVFSRAYDVLSERFSGLSWSLKLFNFSLISPTIFRAIFLTGLRVAHLCISLAVVLVFANYILALFPEGENLNLKPLIRGGMYTLMTVMVTIAVWRSSRVFFTYVRSGLTAGILIKEPLRFQNLTLLSAHQFAAVLSSILSVARWAWILGLAYFSLGTVFSFFEFTREWAGILFGYIARPLQAVGLNLLGYLPNLFFILVICVLTYYIVRFSRFIFTEVHRERIRIAGFYSEWALPTHRLVAFCLFAFAAVIMFPYLPGSGSEAFKGISLFLGFMFSLGNGNGKVAGTGASGKELTRRPPLLTKNRD